MFFFVALAPGGGVSEKNGASLGVLVLVDLGGAGERNTEQHGCGDTDEHFTTPRLSAFWRGFQGRVQTAASTGV